MSADVLKISASVAHQGFTLDVDEAIPLEGVTAVFGPSGAGKTTLLNLIAGFTRPSIGAVKFRDEVWVDTSARAWVPAHKRCIGVLFQDARLFPHYSVAGNLAYADRRSSGGQHGYSCDDIIEATGIGPLLDRAPATLSGGERQRVALARTLLTRPDILLFDEPLAALDRNRKTELLPFLDELPRRFGIPCLYVSHDVDEVSRIADRVMMLEQGRVSAFGPTERVLGSFGLAAGRNPYEAGSVLHGTVRQHDTALGLTEIAIGDNSIWLPLHDSIESDAEIKLKLSARDVAIAVSMPSGLSIQNVLSGTITSIAAPDGSAFCNVEVEVGTQALKSRITRKAAEALALTVGQPVYALIKSASFQR